MQDTFRLYQRSNGVYYVEHIHTQRQSSLKTSDPAAAKRILAGMNQAAEIPAMNIAMAKVYLGGKSAVFCTRTWGDVMKEMSGRYTDATLVRYEKFMKSAAVQSLVGLPLVHTDSSHLLAALFHPRAGVSTNVWLRITHNRALDLGWILTPAMARNAWPDIEYKEKSAITLEEHQRIIADERMDDYRAYFEVLWEIGGSQTDIANLHRDQIDPSGTHLTFKRKKIRSKKRRKNQQAGNVSFIIGSRLRQSLELLPVEGFLFPRLRLLSEDERASHFRKVCQRVSINGITLHFYRYSWAERAYAAGSPDDMEGLKQWRDAQATVDNFFKESESCLARLDTVSRLLSGMGPENLASLKEIKSVVQGFLEKSTDADSKIVFKETVDWLTAAGV